MPYTPYGNALYIDGTFGVSSGGTGKFSLPAGQALIGNGAGAVTAKAIDTAAASGSANLITSGAVYTAIAALLASLTYIAADEAAATTYSTANPTLPVYWPEEE
jgi:hypothetical protein